MDKFMKMTRVTSADKKSMYRSYPIQGKRGFSAVVGATKAQFKMGSNTFLHKRNNKQIYHITLMVGPNSGKRKLVKYTTAIGAKEKAKMVSLYTKFAKEIAKEGASKKQMKGSYFKK
jgi:hypothetical protein